jgi:hypothetical protein
MKNSLKQQGCGSGYDTAMKSDRNLMDPHETEFTDPESSEYGIDPGVQSTILV